MPSYFDNLDWVAIDLETTGLNPWKHEIIEIGAVRFSLYEIGESFQALVKPKKKQDPKARKVHNITNDEIDLKSIELVDSINGLRDFIGNARLVFHNAPFDISFLIRAFESLKMDVPDNYYYDSLYLSKKYFKDRERHSLSHLREILHIDSGAEHRALSDAIATAKVFINLLRERGQDVTSRKKFSKFFRYHRRFNEFKITLPREMDEIEKYFDSLIRQKRIIKLKTRNQDTNRYEQHYVVPQALMVFNQKIYVKCMIHLTNEERLFPVAFTEFHDPDLGLLRF